MGSMLPWGLQGVCMSRAEFQGLCKVGDDCRMYELNFTWFINVKEQFKQGTPIEGALVVLSVYLDIWISIFYGAVTEAILE